MRDKLLAGLAAAALLCVMPSVQAQPVDHATMEDLKKTDTVPPATAPQLPEQSGTTEPSSKVLSSKEEDAFRNGVLTAPGAPTEVDTAPAKFSARSSADDALPISGYRMKLITADQASEILRGLDAGSRASADGHAVIGRELPSASAAQSLTPVPAELFAKFAELRGTGFMKSDGKVIIVDLDNNIVVGVLGG